MVEIKGDPAHPANFGRLCSKGSALGETIDLEGRLLYPEVRGQRVSWDEALTFVVDGFSRIINDHGPKAVAFYVSGQLLTEEYYVANKLMKGFIGAANIDTNSRLCMSSAVAGYKRAFGSDTVPCSYEDLELANLIVLVGSNTAWCHPVVYQRILKAREQRPWQRIVVIDPRRTATCESADLHLAIKPGTDVMLFNGLLNHLHQAGAVAWGFVENHTEGFAEAFKTACRTAPSLPAVAAACDLREEDLAEFYRLFTANHRVVTLFSQGVNQSSSGVDKVSSIINCHLATGRIGKPGMGPFSITGQPNAMGGREVGGLANQLAAHMDLENPVHRGIVQRFWNAPRIPDASGPKAVDLFQAIGRSEVKAVWIIATNPVVTLPDADQVRESLRHCELVVVSDCMRRTDTTELAHVLLPALAWGEKDGTVTNSERRISRQRAFLPAPGEARPDWWIVTQVARRMGYAEAFPYESAAEIFREHAALSGFENAGTRDFDISGLGSLSNEHYAALEPTLWPILQGAGQRAPRLFTDGRFFHANGQARFIAVVPCSPHHAPDERYPLVLNTGRIRDHWHTLTRTGKSPRLSAHTVEPFVEIHPRDAARYHVSDGVLARITSSWGEVIVRVRVTEDQRAGSLFIPMHWSEQFSSAARVDAVVNPVTDPISGQPESKHTPVKIEPFEVAWEAFLLTRRELDPPAITYWVKARGRGHWRYELARDTVPESWSSWARPLLEADDEAGDWLEYSDVGAGIYRTARIVNGCLQACLFIAPTQAQLPDRVWLANLFPQLSLEPADRSAVLAGRPGCRQADIGPIVCSCFSVGRMAILSAIREQGLKSIEAISAALKAGTNCGSCIPEIKALLFTDFNARAARGRQARSGTGQGGSPVMSSACAGSAVPSTGTPVEC
jgi:assimilatory nitrate reductase catalytic subunit